MPMHDWTRVDAGIYHAFHSMWISEIHRAMMKRLPDEYYSLPEQQAAGFGPDVLTLKFDDDDSPTHGDLATKVRPKTRLFQETATEFYLRKKKAVAIHHVSGDQVVAMIEVVSPGNKNSAHGLRSFVRKARELLQQKVHLLIVDPFPVSSRDPHGLHAAIFEEVQDDPLQLPPESPLSLIAYECDDRVRTYLEPVAVGDRLPDMPVFLYPGMYIDVPLETTYLSAWEAVPSRWQRVIAPPDEVVR
jgi:Protein of unknown function (DUF4058)